MLSKRDRFRDIHGMGRRGRGGMDEEL